MASNQKDRISIIIITVITLITIALAIALILLNSIISKKNNQEREKPSPFECGFDPKNSARLPFSLRFYLIAVIFLIFDVEITLLIPLPLISSTCQSIRIRILTLFFISILLAGLYHEWNQGALNWNK